MSPGINIRGLLIAKKILWVIAVLAIHTSCWAQIRVVTTIYPFQAILEPLVRERGEVYSILPPAASPHTFELRPSDIKKVNSANVLFAGGPNLDSWAFQFHIPHRFELLQFVPPTFLLHFEGEEDKVDPKAPALDQHGHDQGVDPHFWTDPLTVKAILPKVVEALCSVDPAGGDTYKMNAEQFAMSLDSLYSRIRIALTPVSGAPVMLSHPFFRYFLSRFNFQLVGVIETSPGIEPTPKELRQLINEVNHHKVKVIFSHSQLSERPSKLVAEAAGIKVHQLDPIGGVAGRRSFDDILWFNTMVLLEALK